MNFTAHYSYSLPVFLRNLIYTKCNPSNDNFSGFLLDCSTDHDVIAATQRYGAEVHHHLFSVTRVWVYVLHRERLKMLGRWRPL